MPMFTRIIESLNARLATLIGGIGMIALAITTGWPEPWWGLLVGIGGLAIVLALIAFALDARGRFKPSVSSPPPPSPLPPQSLESSPAPRERSAFMRVLPGGRGRVEIYGTKIRLGGADFINSQGQADALIKDADIRHGDEIAPLDPSLKDSDIGNVQDLLRKGQAEAKRARKKKRKGKGSP